MVEIQPSRSLPLSVNSTWVLFLLWRSWRSIGYASLHSYPAVNECPVFHILNNPGYHQFLCMFLQCISNLYILHKSSMGYFSFSL